MDCFHSYGVKFRGEAGLVSQGRVACMGSVEAEEDEETEILIGVAVRGSGTLRFVPFSRVLIAWRN